MSPEDLAHLLTVCLRSHTPALHVVVFVAVTSGCRKMEILTLRWGDVDLERGYLRLQQTKNRTKRAVPIPPQTVAVLQQWQRARRFDVDWVFPRPDGQRPLDLDTAWNNAVKRAGITDFHFHDLRHTAASYLAMTGASLLEIAEVLGHQTLQMVKRYTHFTEGHTAPLVHRMAEHLLSSSPSPAGARQEEPPVPPPGKVWLRGPSSMQE